MGVRIHKLWFLVIKLLSLKPIDFNIFRGEEEKRLRFPLL